MVQVTLVLGIGIFALAVRHAGILGALVIGFGLSFLITFLVWSTIQEILSWPIYLPVAILFLLVAGYVVGHWQGRNWRR